MLNWLNWWRGHWHQVNVKTKIIRRRWRSGRTQVITSWWIDWREAGWQVVLLFRRWYIYLAIAIVVLLVLFVARWCVWRLKLRLWWYTLANVVCLLIDVDNRRVVLAVAYWIAGRCVDRCRHTIVISRCIGWIRLVLALLIAVWVLGVEETVELYPLDAAEQLLYPAYALTLLLLLQ